MNIKEEILNIIFNHFINSHDFNGIWLEDVAKELNIDWIILIEQLEQMIQNEEVCIQFLGNPKIIGIRHYKIGEQLEYLKNIKERKITQVPLQLIESEGVTIKMSCWDKTAQNVIYEEYYDYSNCCAYPTPKYLQKHRDLTTFENKPYSKKLALGEPTLKLYFFELAILENYANDPRYGLEFWDVQGRIMAQNGTPQEDIYLKRFGLGVDEKEGYVIGVCLHFLHVLDAKEQTKWSLYETQNKCQVYTEYYENIVLGNPTNNIGVYSAFLIEQKNINDIIKQTFGKPLFRKTYEWGAHNYNQDPTHIERPQEFSMFFIPTTKNYYFFIFLLEKMIGDNLNEEFLNSQLQKKIKSHQTGQKIEALKNWLLSLDLTNKDQTSVEGICKLFNDIHKERGIPAHEIFKNEYKSEYIIEQQKKIQHVWYALLTIREILEQKFSIVLDNQKFVVKSY